MAYPTATQLVDGDGVSGSPIQGASAVAALVALDAAGREALRALSIAAVEEHCQQTFEAVAETRTVDGSGTRELYLDWRLEALTELTVVRTSIGLADVEWDNEHIVLRRVFGNYAVRAIMDEYDHRERREFPREPRAVNITGTWGWTNCPPAVKLALRTDMEDTALADANAMSESLRVMRAQGLRTIAQGNLRAAVEGAPGLNPKVMRLLHKYIWTHPLGMSV